MGPKAWDQVFGNRENYFPYIQNILREKKEVGVSLGNFNFLLDYRRLTIPGLPIFPTPIPLLTGWGSGWEGIVPLGVSLAFEGYEVFFISLPGYGSSSNAPWKYYTRDFIQNSAECLKKAFDALQIREAHLVGHSMGAEILAKFARHYPERSSSLVLLNPSGVHPYPGIFSRMSLIRKFVLSGVALRREYQRGIEASGKQDYMKPMIEWCEKQESPWQLRRLPQRLFEFLSVTRGTLPKNLREVRCPIVYVSGTRDLVFPVREALDILEKNVTYAPSFTSVILEEIHHNPTLFHAEIAAAAIASHLDG